MHDVVTTSTAPKSFFLNTQDDLLPAISITNRPHPTDTNSWRDSDTSENWPPKNDQAIHVLRSKNHSYLPKMASLADSNAGGNAHWLFNANGQLVDVDSESASAGWDLADEIVRLKIGDVAGETGDDTTMRTPPNKMTSALGQLAETSPLESSSSNSIDSSPPSDHQISHSRGSSTDAIESSSQDSGLFGASNPLLSNSINGTPPSEQKERPHSFSGGLSSADLRRLQEAGDGSREDDSTWMQYREPGNEQLSYPSLTSNAVSIHRPQPQASQLFDYRSAAQGGRDDLQIDYNLQQRNFNPLPPSGMPSYRQPVRGYPQQPGLLPSPPTMGYPTGHSAHMSLGSSQQMYDMMLPSSHDNPAVSRVQQQHTPYRGSHHHSASDPSTLREPQLAMMGNNMSFAPGMYPPGMAPSMPMYPNQYYGQEAYARGDPAMVARLQAQYTGPYGMLPAQLDGGLSSPTSVTSGGQNGPSANNRKLGLYKTELCRSWEEKGSCRYGAKCQFAHGEDELRKVSRHPKYKTEICRTFWVSGSCPYGKRCCFIHTELPAAGGATPQDAPPPLPRPDGRARSLSTNSDPNEGGVSLLARISAKRTHESSTNTTSTPVETSSSNGYQFTRPPTGSLRVDTSALDGSSMKQNKSAYPAFASNGVLLPNVDHKGAKSPAPVTAGPDLGRHNSSRMEIVGYNQRMNQTPPSNPRHSFNGTEEMNFSTPSQPTPGHSYTLSSDSTGPQQRVTGHVRAGSAGNWASFSRSNHLSSGSFSHGASGNGDGTINSPWSTTEMTMGGSRLHEKAAWA